MKEALKIGDIIEVTQNTYSFDYKGLLAKITVIGKNNSIVFYYEVSFLGKVSAAGNAHNWTYLPDQIKKHNFINDMLRLLLK